MAKEKKPVHKVQMTDGKRQIIQQLLQEYDIETAEDIQDALKDLLGGTIKEMMEAEMDDHLGYQKSERYDSDDYRNGYKTKRVNSSFGSLDIQVPQDRKSSFEPQVVKKRQKDISSIDVQRIKNAMIMLASRRPIKSIDSTVIDYVVEITGTDRVLVENTLLSAYPHGLIGGFLANYYEMAFKGTEEAVEFEKATTDLFRDVFGYKSIHLGQTGSKSAPDILLLSDSEGYQAIIDNKAYSKYSITGDHHNRMVHNYIEKISNYSDSDYPIGFFSYIAGGFISTFDKQVASEIDESNVNGSGITVATFIKMIEKNTEHPYSHKQLRDLFSIGREIKLADI